MNDVSGNNGIRTRPSPLCYVCGSEGGSLYGGLRDRLFGTPGAWDHKQCPECGLIWLDPAPLEEDMGKAYLSYYTHGDPGRSSSRGAWIRLVYRAVRESYLAREHGYGAVAGWKKLAGLLGYVVGLRDRFDLSVMYLPHLPGGRLLDVGCGGGRFLEFMVDLGWNAEGVDFDPVAVRSARSRGLEARLGTLEAQGYPDNRFDAVVMNHSIEHVHDPSRLLRECRRILKPGGRLVVTTPNSESWGHEKFGDSWLHLDPPRHIHVFNPSSLGRLAKEVGFAVPKVSTTARAADVSFIASRSIRRKGEDEAGAPRPLSALIRGQVWQLAESALLKARPNAGEELVLVARK